MNIHKSVAGLLLAAILVVTAVPSHASAHVLAEDNGISAVMHIPPYDAPEAGVPTKLEFEFGTDSGGFQIANYSVKVAVSNNSKAIQTSPVAAPYFGAASEGTATVQFPSTAIYNVRLSGTPLKPTLPAFTMTYTVRVATMQNGTASTQHTTNASQTIYIGSAVLLVFGMFTARQLVNGGRYKTVRVTDDVKSTKSQKKRS